MYWLNAATNIALAPNVGVRRSARLFAQIASNTVLEVLTTERAAQNRAYLSLHNTTSCTRGNDNA